MGIANKFEIDTNSSERGKNYILKGKYLQYGVPLDLYLSFKDYLIDDNYLDNVLKADSTNSVLSGFVNFKSEAGDAINASCIKCHSSQLNGNYLVGLGNIYSNYQKSKKFEAFIFENHVNLFGNDKHIEILKNFIPLYREIADNTKTENPIVNPAFRLEESCFRLLNPKNLELEKKPNFNMEANSIASDIPPLWNAKYKNHFYYNGMGVGNKEKLIMQISIFGVSDTLFLANQIANFSDVLQWIYSLKAPKYPYNIDISLAEKGGLIFEKECQSCHGKYENGILLEYYNKIVPLQKVGTDPFYALYFSGYSNLPKWYNDSWFAKRYPYTKLIPNEGYIAPPLTGIWASAPYLHNASIPTLDALLNPNIRPLIWELSLDTQNIDSSKVGIKHRVISIKKGDWCFDTTIPGYSNKGHMFSDKLSEEEKRQLLEYLKTL
jgi:cytochrome c2